MKNNKNNRSSRKPNKFILTADRKKINNTRVKALGFLQTQLTETNTTIPHPATPENLCSFNQLNARFYIEFFALDSLYDASFPGWRVQMPSQEGGL